MKIEEKKFVALTYTLTVDGEVVDQATEQHPLEFVFGAGYLLPEFENNLKGLSRGDKFSFTLSAAQGYGEVDPNMVVELPHDAFRINGEIEAGLLEVGNNIPMMTAEGAQLLGIIREVGENTVKMDFNHPMAGQTLNFEGEVLEVRDATDADYPQMGGGCGCGCEDNSCDDCGDGHCH